LGFSGAGDIVECELAVIPINPRGDDLMAAEIGFLVVGVAGGGGVAGVVRCAVDGCYLAGFDVEVVDVVPF
jgi:hypothetical protein